MGRRSAGQSLRIRVGGGIHAFRLHVGEGAAQPAAGHERRAGSDKGRRAVGRLVGGVEDDLARFGVGDRALGAIRADVEREVVGTAELPRGGLFLFELARGLLIAAPDAGHHCFEFAVVFAGALAFGIRLHKCELPVVFRRLVGDNAY